MVKTPQPNLKLPETKLPLSNLPTEKLPQALPPSLPGGGGSLLGTTPVPSGYGVTTKVYFDGLTNKDCIAPSYSAPATVDFWQPTYYVEIVNHKEQSYLFPPYGQKLLDKLTDLFLVDTSKKEVVDTLVGAINPKMKKPVLEVLGTGLAYSTRGTSPGSRAGTTSHFREVHIWKYENPDAFSELLQGLICLTVSKALGSSQGEKEGKDMLTNLASHPPILYPVYLSEIDWLEWNSGLFDLIFGRTFLPGEEVGAWGRKYARSGMSRDSDPLRSTLLTAARAMSRASDDFTGGFVKPNIYEKPDKFKFSIILPDDVKPGCFTPGDSLPEMTDSNVRFANAEKITKMSDVGILAWEKVGNTSKLNQCLLVSTGEFIAVETARIIISNVCKGTTIGEGVCASGMATLAASEKVAKALDALSTLVSYYQMVQTVLDAIQQAIDLYEKGKQIYEFTKAVYTLQGKASSGELGKALDVQRHTEGEASPKACDEAFGGVAVKLKDVFLRTSPAELEPLLKQMPSNPGDLSSLETLCKDFGSQTAYTPAYWGQPSSMNPPEEVSGVYRGGLDKVCDLKVNQVGDTATVEGVVKPSVDTALKVATTPVQQLDENRIRECQASLFSEEKREEALKLLTDVAGKTLAQLAPKYADLAGRAQKVVNDAVKHPKVEAAEAWVKYQGDHKRWEAGGKKGQEPPEPDLSIHPKPKNLCEMLEDADKKKTPAYEYGCKGNVSVIPKPVDMFNLPAFDPYTKLPTCQEPSNTQGIPLGMFGKYMEVLKGAGQAKTPPEVHRREWHSDAEDFLGGCRTNRKAQMSADFTTSDGQSLHYDSCIEPIQENESELGQVVSPYPPPCGDDAGWEDQWTQIY